MKIKIPLVPGWRNFWRAWSVRAALIGAALPEVLQLVATNSEALPLLSPDTKESIRLACLLAVPVLWALRQGDKPLAQKEPE